MKLNLGCGRDVLVGWTNVDQVALKEHVYTWDLENMPWPWGDDTFEEVYASHILEHLPNKMKVIEEIWRVCKHSARVEIRLPAWNHLLFWQDPTHCTPWHLDNFDYFKPGNNWNYYTKARFDILVKEERVFAGGPELYWVLKAIKEEDNDDKH